MNQPFTIKSQRVLVSGHLIPASLIIYNEAISEIKSFDDPALPARVDYYSDQMVMHGLIDAHVHINEPGRTEWEVFSTINHSEK